MCLALPLPHTRCTTPEPSGRAACWAPGSWLPAWPRDLLSSGARKAGFPQSVSGPFIP